MEESESNYVLSERSQTQKMRGLRFCLYNILEKAKSQVREAEQWWAGVVAGRRMATQGCGETIAGILLVRAVT